jgi:hypothetical protein
MAAVMWIDGVPRLGNTLASSTTLQAITWLMQVMPLFFIAGGAASSLSWASATRKDVPYIAWAWQRVQRLLKPVVVYLAVMLPIGAGVAQFSESKVSTPLLNLMTQLLWFLGIYIIITCLTPFYVYLERNLKHAAVLVWIAVVAAIDFLRLSDSAPAVVSLINFVAVWSVAAHFGIWYINRRISAPLLMLAIGVALSINVCLVHFGPYPISLVGMPDETFSNMAPPSLVMALHTVICWAAVLLLRERLTQLLENLSIWRFVVSINMSAMTMYLWHLPTLTLLTVLSHMLGMDRPLLQNSAGTIVPGENFWLWSILFWSICALAIYAVVQLLWFTEHIQVTWWDKPRTSQHPSTIANLFASVCITAIGLGLLLISGSGLAGFPNRLVEFSGLSWTSGFAVSVLVSGVLGLRMAIVAGRSSHQSTQ